MLLKVVGKHPYHKLVGDELTFGNIAVGDFAEFGSACDVVAEDFPGGNMVKSVLLYDALALRTFTASGRTENHDVKHSFVLSVY